MRHVLLVTVLLSATPSHAAPPPNSTGRYHDWFRSLEVPDAPGSPCCTLADCRMVDARWDDQTQRYFAKVMREKFSNGLERPILSQEDADAYQAAKNAWMLRWAARYGDVPEVWIEIPNNKINRVQNPTGHAVLCWSVFNTEFNGIYCFVPFQAAFHDLADRTRRYG